MTELERYEPVQTTVLRSTVDQRTDGWVDAIGPIGELAEQVANTEFVPKGLRGKPAAVIAAILYGRELEMPPMQALANIHVVDGRPGLAAEQMRAMVLAAGHEITYPKFTGSQVVAVGRRRQPDGTLGAPTEVEWNTAMVQWAGLAGKDNHKKYPRAMLTARATADLCRLIFPDVTRGLPSLEELEDGADTPESAKSGSASTDEPKAKVSRRGAGVTKKADEPDSNQPPRAAADSTARPQAPRPPLPSRGATAGEPTTEQVADAVPDAAPTATADVPAGDTPGEGEAETPVTPPAGTTMPDGPERELDFSMAADSELARQLERVTYKCPQSTSHHDPHEFEHEGFLYWCAGLTSQDCSNTTPHTHHRWATDRAFKWCKGLDKRQCPHISNGQQCRYYAEHEGDHSFGGGLGDPVTARRCKIGLEHAAHAWNSAGDEWHTCSGKGSVEVMSEGDGSPEDVAATGSDEAYAAQLEDEEEYADAEVVPDRPEGIHPGQKRALEAAFTSLKVADRAQRHHAASALLGRKVTTFKSITDDEGGLSANDGSRLLSAMGNLSTLDQLEELIQQAAEKWGESDGGTTA